MRAALIGVLLTAAVLLLPAAAAQAADPAFRGAQMHPFWGSMTATDVDRELDVLQGAGVTAVRVDLSWSSIETNCKNCLASTYPAKVDAFMQDAASRGIKVIGMFWSTPCWASSAPDDVKQNCDGAWWDRGVTRYPPTNTQDYVDRAVWAVNRWGAYLAGLEIWNEPNLSSMWRTATPAADYAKLLRAAYPALKRSQYPALPVVAGVLSRSDGNFVQSLYANGIGGHFDAFSVHPYSDGYSPMVHKTGDGRMNSFIDGVPWIHDILVSHGDDKPIWLTELGYATCTDWTNKYCVTEADQAKFTAEAWTLLSQWPWVQAATQYNLRDRGTDQSSRDDNMGLIGHDYTPKPALSAFRDQMSRLANDIPSVLTPAVDAAPSVSFTSPATGSTFSKTLAMAASTSDDNGLQRVEFWFDGVRIASDITAPYSYSYTVPKKVSYGSHRLDARAVDTAGQTTTASVTVHRVR